MSRFIYAVRGTTVLPAAFSRPLKMSSDRLCGRQSHVPVSTSDVLRSPRAAGDKCRGRICSFTNDDSDELAECLMLEGAQKRSRQIESVVTMAEIRYDGLKYLPSVLFIK